MRGLEQVVSTPEIDWGRVIERLCFLFPPVVGIGAIGVVREADPGVPGLERGLVLFGSFGYTLLTIGVVIAIVLDARRVRSASKAGARSNRQSRTKATSRSAPDSIHGWQPNPWLNAAFALLWAPAAGVVYLARRHRALATPAGWSGWWLVVAISLAATVIGIAAAVVGIVLSIPGLLVSGVAVAGAIAIGAFPIALHQDAAYVSAQNAGWQPNPGLYLGLAFVSLFVPPLQPLLATYYLFRRRRTLGTS